MCEVHRRFGSDMFIRFALTFEALGDLTETTALDVGCGSGASCSACTLWDLRLASLSHPSGSDRA